MRGAQCVPMGKSMICTPSELYKYFIDKEPQCNGDLVAVFAFRFVHNLNACMYKKFSIRSRKLRTLKCYSLPPNA